MSAIALDTETTGVDSERQPVEVAYFEIPDFPETPEALFTSEPKWYEQRFYPTVPIHPNALKAHGIKKETLVGFPNYIYELLKIPPEAEYIIGHNISFDVNTIHPNDRVFKEICTLKLCRKLYPEAKKYSLTALIAYFYPDLSAKLIVGAHGAKVDTKLSILLLQQILTDFDFDSWEVLHLYSCDGEKTSV
jgi:DNA polymerase III epsilon subunit-like protein